MPEGCVLHQIPVSFAGSGAGTAPLSWGQRSILIDMRETGWTHNVSGVLDLPEDITVEQVAGELGRFLSTYPALRTRMGVDGQGNRCQVAAASGETALDVFDVDDDADPERFAYDLWYSRLLTPFDHHHDWPLRMAVVRHRGRPRWRALTLNHLVVDGGSYSLLMADLGVGDMAGRATGDPRTPQLLEIARREQTPAVRRVSDLAMGYWESQLRTVPPLTFGEPTHPEGRQGKRYWHGRSHSPAAYLAMLAIAARTRTNTSRVLLAILAVAIARVTGVTPLTAKLIVSNRFRPGFAEAIAPLSQNSLITIDVADATVDEVVARARRASLVAAKHAYYDPEQLEGLGTRLDRERGWSARVSCRMNDRRMYNRQVADEAARDCRVTRAQIERALPDSFVVWDGTVDHLPEQAFITVEDEHEAIRLQVIFDMACFTEAEVEALLRGVEEVAVEAAFDPAVPTRVARVPAPASS
jgi:Condensation domain